MADSDEKGVPKLTETEKNYFSSWSKDPTIMEIGGDYFFVCGYTGMTTKHRAGLPGHLLGKSAKTVGTFGCFKDYNTLARALVEAVRNGWVTSNTMDLISSWFADNLGPSKIDMPPPRENLERFGGRMADDEYNGTYVVMYANKMILAADEHELREKNKAAAKANHQPTPTLLSALRGDANNQLAIFKVAILPQAPSFFAYQRVPGDQSSFGHNVLTALQAETLPVMQEGAFVAFTPKLPSAANTWLDANMRPAAKAALLANRERAQRERAAKRKQSSAMSKLRKKVATKAEKRRIEMGEFAAQAAKMVTA